MFSAFCYKERIIAKEEDSDEDEFDISNKILVRDNSEMYTKKS